MRLKLKVRTALFISLSILAIFGIARFCHHATKGFALSKIQSNLIEDIPFEMRAQEDKEFLNALFEQKFHYLGRGLQSFVFESEDKKFVLKLFNNRYQRKIHLFTFLSKCPFMEMWAMEQKKYYQQKLLKTFQSYQIAFHEMKDSTGLECIHLCKTSDLPRRITLVDPLHICHEVDPNSMGFLIQKKATLVYPALKEYLSRNDFDGARQALSSLCELFFWKWRHGIADNDPLIRTNYGFCDGKAIQIDVGPLSKQSCEQTLEQRRSEITKITASLKFWLNQNAPELTAFLERELEYQLSSEG